MHDTRSTRRTSLLKRLFVKFAVFMLIVGILPVSQPALTPVTQAAEGNACPAPVAMINGGFEQPKARNVGDKGSPGSEQYWMYFYGDEVPGWETDASDNRIQIMQNSNELLGPVQGGNGQTIPVVAAEGTQFAELNAHEAAMLYQDVATVPGQTIYWRLAHRGEYGTDTMQVRIGSPDIPTDRLPVIEQMSSEFNKWTYYTGEYTVPEGQTLTRFGFEAVSTSNGAIAFGNLLDDIFLGTEPCVTSTKTVNPPGEIGVGTELTYTINTKNEGGDIAGDTVVTDAIPAGTEYVPGSMVLINGSTTKKLTDEADTDEGQFEGKQVSIKLGDLQNASQLPGGITVQFKVKVLSDYSVKSINNKAQIDYDNLLSGEKEQTETNGTDSSVIFPKLESSKTMTLQEKAAGNTDAEHPEVGDTLRYTIQSRNTVAKSIVKNLEISDAIPSELKYVPGSLTVDGVAVTDAEGDDKGHYAGGKAVGQLGDVSDQNWHTVQFEATVQPGQAGKDIINIAAVGGDNVDTPDRPREEVQVYPRNPQIESEKFASNVDASKATYDVGDTISYTIRTRGVINDTYLENLTITDTLPAGLQYVPDSLKVDGVSVSDAQDGDAGHSVSGEVYGSFGNVNDLNWHTLEFKAVIQDGQGGKTIQNTGKVTGDNINQPGEPTDKVVVELPPVPPVDPPTDPQDPDDGGSGGGGGGSDDDDDNDSSSPKLESEKSAKDVNGGSIEVGDTIEYTIRARNTVSNSSVTNMVISDDLPEELEYVPGTLKVDGATVTDSNDSDKGKYVDGTVTGSLGTVTDTDWHTLVFEAKVVKGEKGDKIKNVGEVTGGNVNTPDKPSEEITVGDTVPVMESEKAANDLNGGTIQIGDVIEYSIRTRNTVADSVVTNLKISDVLRTELQYVPGSLKVDGVTVTDAQDSDKGHYVDGNVSGQFGDVTDTDWHTVVFQAKLIAGQNGQTIRNTAEVTGDNLNNPDQPSEDIVIGGGSGSNSGVPGEAGNGPSYGGTNNPGWGGSDSGSTDSGQSGGSGGTGGTGQSGTSGDSANGGNSGNGGGHGSKLPATATNMYGYLLVGFIILLAGLFLLRRKKA
ncbi:isopeptide-forming domain-containing fimbrial protein [Paenibacillus medicaginis]|uniref:Isopeptide-forming domain-containing fimbrial protein n=1 Tax=Paenibacillus medicaginis TaxID=1470560 RepID=A0ABV5C4D8_9BACL